MEKRNLLLIFSVIPVIFLILCASSLFVESAVRPTPKKITFTPGSDGSYQGSLKVTNEGSSPVKLSVRVLDWNMNKNGKVKLIPPGSIGNNSLAEWISGYPEQVEIPANDVKKITFKVKVPTENDRPRWGAFVIRPIGEESGATEDLHIGVKVQYAITLYQEKIGEVNKHGDITNMRVVSGKASSALVKISFKNSSQAFLRPNGTLTIRDKQGEIELEKDIQEFLVLPNHTRIISKSLDTLDSGKYRATVILDYGTKERVGARIAFNRD